MEGFMAGGGERPPYIEVYPLAPLLFVSLSASQRATTLGAPPAAQLHFWHGVQCAMDDVASGLGLFKIKTLGAGTGPGCLFSMAPDCPARQQADVMLHAARQIQQALSQVCLADGSRLACQVTMHAGQFAGGVVGKVSWTYE